MAHLGLTEKNGCDHVR